MSCRCLCYWEVPHPFSLRQVVAASGIFRRRFDTLPEGRGVRRYLKWVAHRRIYF